MVYGFTSDGILIRELPKALDVLNEVMYVCILLYTHSCIKLGTKRFSRFQSYIYLDME